MLSVLLEVLLSAGEFRPEDNMRVMLSGQSEGATPYTSLKGQNLTKINLKNYKINIQDADTLTVSRDLGSGGMRDFFFWKKEKQVYVYSFSRNRRTRNCTRK